MLFFILVWLSSQIVPFVFLPALYVVQYFLECKIVNWEITVKILKLLTNFTFEQVNEERLISSGYILCNHRTWTDFAVDQYYSNASQTGRLLAYIACPASLFNYLDGRAIIINRNSSSHDILKKILEHHIISPYKRIVIYPEGTRRNYSVLENKDSLKQYLKYGLLKRIYEHKQMPVQCFISSNKELVCNEKKLSCRRNVRIKNAISKPIYPAQSPTFEKFIDEVCTEWFHCWKMTHV